MAQGKIIAALLFVSLVIGTALLVSVSNRPTGMAVAVVRQVQDRAAVAVPQLPATEQSHLEDLQHRVAALSADNAALSADNAAQAAKLLAMGNQGADAVLPQNLPHSADCGVNPFLVAGILAAPSNRSKMARATIRETWARFPVQRPVTIRFLLALNSDGQIPPELAAEADTFGDIIFLNTLDKYANLAMKVSLFFKWACDFCPSASYVLKTDDDSFVRVDLMVAKLLRMPRERIFWGLKIERMPAIDDNGKPKHGNVHNWLKVWPPYMSGAGYVLSLDLANIVGRPPVPFFWLMDEDVATGLRLFPYNVTYVSDNDSFSPWGHCKPNVILLHYQRSAALMRRRFIRAMAGKSVCGEPFADANTVCVRAGENDEFKLSCPRGRTVSEILLATYGKEEGECVEGLDGLLVSDVCHAPRSMELVSRECMNKATCAMAASNRYFGGDPCRNTRKALRVVVKCK